MNTILFELEKSIPYAVRWAAIYHPLRPWWIEDQIDQVKYAMIMILKMIQKMPKQGNIDDDMIIQEELDTYLIQKQMLSN